MFSLFPEVPASFLQRKALINAAHAGDADARALVMLFAPVTSSRIKSSQRRSDGIDAPPNRVMPER